MQNPSNHSKWKWMAPLGLTLAGLGLSLVGEATIWKMQELYWLQWAGLGTLGLLVFNSGLAIFGDAVKRRFWLEMEEKKGDLE